MGIVGERAKSRRKALGLTQTKVAQACGITQQAYEKLESGEVRRPRYLLELADTLEASAKWLLTGENPPPPAHRRLSQKILTGNGIAVYSYTADTKIKQSINWEKDIPIEWTPFFPGLDNSSRYSSGLRIQGNDLEPVYRHGHTVFINRQKHPVENGHCVYEKNKNICICKYLSHDNNNYYFMDLNSQDKKKVLQKKIEGIYMIVGVLYHY